MEYGDKFIFTRKGFYNDQEFVKCIFMMDRKDKNKYIVEEDYTINKRYMDIPYTKLDNIYTIEDIEKYFLEINMEINKKLDFWNNVLNNIKDYHYFNKVIKILNELKQQEEYWQKNLDSQKARMVREEIIKDTEKILSEIRKGIKRRTKRIYSILQKYKDIDVSLLTDITDKQRLAKDQIKKNNEKLADIKKFLSS